MTSFHQQVDTMKTIIILILASFAFATVLGQGVPTRKCPPGEHSVLYCPQRAEPSCDNPTIHDKPFGPCGVPQCFCNTPNVRNTITNKCMPLSEC